MFIMPAIGPMNLIEFLWTLIAAAGAGFAFFCYIEAHQDREALDRLGITNGRRTLANLVRRDEITRFVAQLIFMLIGLYSGGQYNSNEYDIARLIVSLGLVSAEVLIAYASYAALRDRREIIGKGIRSASKGK